MSRPEGNSTVDNVLLVTVDSLRTDHLALFGVDDDHAETTTALAEDGVSFEHAFATGPGTTPSFPAMLTGTLPLSHGGLGPLTDDRPRVAAELAGEGIHTGAFQCNPFLSTHFNYDVGFDTFKDYQNPLMGVATRLFPRGIEISNPKLRKVDNVLHLTDAIKKTYQLTKGKPRPYVGADVITDDAIDWLDSVADPFFGWVHYMDVHHPCFPPKTYRERFDIVDVTQTEVSEWYSALLRDPGTLDKSEIDSLRRLYGAAIDYTDDQIGRIVDHLIESGRFENTMVVLTSDHGELFGEHGGYGKPERLYDELLHVPLVVANGPDHLSETTDNLVSLLDIPPMIHEALGLSIPDNYEGRRPGVDPDRDFVMAEHEVKGDVIVGARSLNWLYEGDEIRDEHRLFDLRNGFERVDADHPEATVVRSAVSDRLAHLDVQTRHLEDEVEGDVQDRLEDLGYI